jgi:serine phosphatase RsbU (regulator of sigma subunit)/predicted ester cyclase
MSVEENMALARRFLEARGRADLDAMERMMAPDFVDHTLAPGQQPDREGYKRQVAEYVTAFSDVRFVIEDQVAAGDKVVSRISGRGIHDRRELLGTTPTGREMTYMAIVIHRISEGKIAEEWGAGTGLSELRGQRLEQEARERERIEQELRVARRIQQALLPEAIPQSEGWEIAQFYQPAREVGGDFYDFLQLVDGHVGLVVGDVSGKGIPAAVLMANTQSVLRTVAQRGSVPGQTLMEANEVLCAYVPPNMFVTCFYGILDPESGRLVYANAGHNLPCRRHRGQVDELRARGMPLGLMPGMSYEEKEVVLEAGDSALFYTDGLVEAHNPQGEMFGTPRLRSLLSERFESGRTLSATLVEELERFTGEGWEQEDDITLLALRHVASLS